MATRDTPRRIRVVRRTEPGVRALDEGSEVASKDAIRQRVSSLSDWPSGGQHREQARFGAERSDDDRQRTRPIASQSCLRRSTARDLSLFVSEINFGRRVFFLHGRAVISFRYTRKMAVLY